MLQIPAIIMAGGKGTRFIPDKKGINQKEKLLLLLGNKTLIEHVIDATLESKYLNRIIIAISRNTKETTKKLKELKKERIFEIIKTPGKGYHSDLKYVVKKLKLGITLTLVADIPLIKPEIIDKIINFYFNTKKQALSVMAEEKKYAQLGLKPTNTFKSDKYKKRLVPIGINIIDGRYINLPEMSQEILIINSIELLYNINTLEDYLNLKKKLKFHQE